MGEESSAIIIGGKGRLGRLFSRELRAAGYSVDCFDRDDPRALAEAIRGKAYVVVSVPIPLVTEVLTQLAPHIVPSQAVFDLCSVKTHLREALHGLPGEVFSLHPMFGPSVESFQGQSCIYCPVRPGPLAKAFRQRLEERGCATVEMDLNEHDPQMAFIQGVTHFQAIVAAQCFRELGISPEDSLSISSPVYRLRMLMIGRIMAQSPDLYTDILVYNPHIAPILEKLEQLGAKLRGDISAGRRGDIIADFTGARQALGSFPEEALEITSRLLRNLLPTARSKPEI